VGVKTLADSLRRIATLSLLAEKVITTGTAFALRLSRWLWYVAAEPKQGRNPP